MIIIYNILIFIAFILFLPKMFFRFVTEGKYRHNFFQRFYFVSPDFGSRQYLWIHAVSLGEVRSVRQLLPGLKLNTGLPILLTTVTETGYQEGMKSGFDRVCYLPYDFSFSLVNFMKKLNFQAILIMETEIWPGLLYHVNKSGRPAYIINGRISDKAFKRYLPFRKILHMIFKKRITKIFCRTDMDMKRYIEIGAPADTVALGGNIKLIDTDRSIDSEYRDRLIKNLGLSKKRVFIAASTHPGEDRMMISVYMRLKMEFPELYLILVPRHPERKDELFRLLSEEGLKSCASSEISTLHPGTDCLVVDQIGYLKTLYSMAEVVFVGGSFVPVGGHNIFEAILFRTPVFYGPHMENFTDMDEVFTGRFGLKVQNMEELYHEALDILKHPPGEASQELEILIDQNNRMVWNMMSELENIVRKGLRE